MRHLDREASNLEDLQEAFYATIEDDLLQTNARWGGACDHEPKELTVEEQHPRSAFPPPPTNHLPAQPGPKKESQQPQNGLLHYTWQAPPPPRPKLHPVLRTNDILYKCCSTLQGAAGLGRCHNKNQSNVQKLVHHKRK